MQNDGIEGEIYPDFKPFIPEELRKHLGVFIVHGRSSTPDFNMKFQSQAEDDINGNDFVKWCLGPAAVRRHKHFRRFFATQYPLIITPPKSYNQMIEELLKWIKRVSKKAWRLSKKIYVDEQTTGFKGGIQANCV